MQYSEILLLIYNVNPKSTEPNHESLAIRINRKLRAIDVIDTLASLFILRGVPGHIRSDNGPKLVAQDRLY